MSGFILVHAPGERPAVTSLLKACPFLTGHVDLELGDTMAFGVAARLITEGQLSETEEDQVFELFNQLAETGSPSSLDILATGVAGAF